ncbi:MAG: hypothetical protein FWD73_14620 [Polyangiaceae bacterium]|nr:hypothetical protein [Polyangiaceae bacterium]
MRVIHGVVAFVLFVAACTGYDLLPYQSTSQNDAGSIDAGSESFSFDTGSTPSRVLQGTTTKVPLSIVRSTAPASDIQITLSNPPPGITAGPLTIPSSASTGDLEIAVAKTVLYGPLDVTIEGHVVGAAGTSESASAILPLLVDHDVGSLDTTFATGGRLIDVFGSQAYGLVDAFVSSDDTIFVVSSCSYSYYACIARLTPDGALDPTYGVDGIATVTDLNSPTAAALLSDGRIVVGGNSAISATYYNAAYNIVPSSGNVNDASVVMDMGVGSYHIDLMAALPDDSVVLAIGGYVSPTSFVEVAKIASDGELDTSFGIGGGFSSRFLAIDSYSSDATGIAVRPTGEIFLAGSWYSGVEDYGILQLDKSGAIDATFGTGGQTSFPMAINGGELPVLADGRVIALSDNGIVAIKADGTGLDSTFGVDGTATIGGVVSRVFLDNQNRLLVTSSADGMLESVSRLTTTGMPDTSFGVNGQNGTVTQSLPAGFSSGTSYVARVQHDGRIVVVSEAPASLMGPTVVVVSRLWN